MLGDMFLNSSTRIRHKLYKLVGLMLSCIVLCITVCVWLGILTYSSTGGPLYDKIKNYNKAKHELLTLKSNLLEMHTICYQVAYADRTFGQVENDIRVLKNNIDKSFDWIVNNIYLEDVVIAISSARAEWQIYWQTLHDDMMPRIENQDVASFKKVLAKKQNQKNQFFIRDVSYATIVIADKISKHEDDIIKLVLIFPACIFVAMLILSIIFVSRALKTSLSITAPLEKFVQDLEKITQEGDLSVIPNTDTELEDLQQLEKSLYKLIHTTNHIIQQSKHIADGDLTVNLEMRSEKDHMVIALKEMISRLKDLVIGMKDGGNQLEESSETFAVLLDQTASSIESLSANSEQIAHSSIMVSNHIGQAFDSIQAINQSSQEGYQKSERLIEKADVLIQLNNKNDQVASNLRDQSEHLEKITTVITKFGKQINLLALNATIEAARAGEVGRGFAVVADKVKELAMSSNDALQEISCIIKMFQDNIEQLYQSIQQSNQFVHEWIALNEDTLVMFKAISGGIDLLTSNINKVSLLSNEEADNTKASSLALQKQADIMEKLNNTAGQLADMAHGIKMKINTFKI